jgi:hypothetical protein
MGKSHRQWYEVRIREDGVKKSKFYLEVSPQAAAESYKGTGRIMWVEKASKERFLGIGQFFRLGDDLLKEFARSEIAVQKQEGRDKEKVRSKRAFNKARKEMVN